MFRFVVLVCAVFALATGNPTQVSQCISNPGDLPVNTYIEGCSTPPCVLPQLRDAIVNIDFVPNRPVQSMRTLATAYMTVGSVTVPIPYDLGADSITCNFLTNAACPVNAGQWLNYRLRVFIEPIFPVGTEVTVEFRVVEESNNSPMICIRVPLRIANPIA